MDESKSERIIKGPLDGEAPAEVKHVDNGKSEVQISKKDPLLKQKAAARSALAATKLLSRERIKLSEGQDYHS